MTHLKTFYQSTNLKYKNSSLTQKWRIFIFGHGREGCSLLGALSNPNFFLYFPFDVEIFLFISRFLVKMKRPFLGLALLFLICGINATLSKSGSKNKEEVKKAPKVEKKVVEVAKVCFYGDWFWENVMDFWRLRLNKFFGVVKSN